MQRRIDGAPVLLLIGCAVLLGVDFDLCLLLLDGPVHLADAARLVAVSVRGWASCRLVEVLWEVG